MSNSALVSYTKISPNRNSPRNQAIDRISIHCVVGQCTAERIGEIFASWYADFREVFEDRNTLVQNEPNCHEQAEKVKAAEIYPDFSRRRLYDRVLYEGSVYESTIDGNTWSPEEYPAGWAVIAL